MKLVAYEPAQLPEIGVVAVEFEVALPLALRRFARKLATEEFLQILKRRAKEGMR